MLKSVLATELQSFGEELRIAEARAGDSEGAYVEFLQAKLRYCMRQEGRESLERRDAVLILAASEALVFARPYIKYTTSETIDNKPALICVPVLLDSVVPELTKSLGAARETLVQALVATHNVKGDGERRAVRVAFEAGKGLPGLPSAVEPWVAHRLRFLAGDFMQFVQ